MSESRTPHSLITAAEGSAAAGDHAAAERLLREAAALQEAILGPLHPDLANTLNNLGVVCEITDNPVDAEHYFRRACAIASASLPADHPFVATSRKNLEDFCAARGKPVKLDAISLAVNGGPIVRPAGTEAEGPEHGSPVRTQRERRATWTRPVVAAVIAAAALSGFGTAVWLGSANRSERAASASRQASPSIQASSLEPSTTEEPSDDRVIAREAGREPVEDRSTGPTLTQPGPDASDREEPRPAAPRPTAAAAAPVVSVARLCRELSTSGPEWRCVPPPDPSGSGPLSFYTRLRSPAPAVVQHRWYRGGRLHRTVNLKVGANMGDGYRTYSRSTVDARGSSDWRVELRASDGTVLHEERFAVR